MVSCMAFPECFRLQALRRQFPSMAHATFSPQAYIISSMDVSNVVTEETQHQFDAFNEWGGFLPLDALNVRSQQRNKRTEMMFPSQTPSGHVRMPRKHQEMVPKVSFFITNREMVA